MDGASLSGGPPPPRASPPSLSRRASTQRRLLELEQRVQHLERVTRAQSEREAELVARLQANARREQLQLMMRGTVLTKFHYTASTATPSARLVQLSEDMTTLAWRRPDQLTTPTRLPVARLVGVLFGAKSFTFARRSARPPEWLCFSLVTNSRTIDFACEDEEVVLAWVLGLQSLLEDDVTGTFDRGTLVAMRGWMKLRAAALDAGIPVTRLLARHIKETYLRLRGEASRTTRSLLIAHQGEHRVMYRGGRLAAEKDGESKKKEEHEEKEERELGARGRVRNEEEEVKMRALDVSLSAETPLALWLQALPHTRLVKLVDGALDVMERVSRLTVQGGADRTALEALQDTEQHVFALRKDAQDMLGTAPDGGVGADAALLRTLVLRLASGEAAELSVSPGTSPPTDAGLLAMRAQMAEHETDKK